MRKIQMVDLLGQYHEIQEKIDVAVIDTIRSTAFINGPEVKAFQFELEDYLDVKHVIPCGNGTDALQVAMMALDLKQGDEIITPAFSYAAVAEVAALLGLIPVFADVDPDTFLIDTEEIRQLIGPKTKAIVPVHLFGQNADMAEILSIAEEFNLYVIEDAAQSIGSEYTFFDGSRKKSGTIGDFGCTSFFPSKNLGCYGDGGALMTNNDELAAKARMFVNHGQEKKYYHKTIGINSRLDSIQAAVLRCKLPHLDAYNARRFENALRYNQALSGIDKIATPCLSVDSSHAFHQYTLRVSAAWRNELKDHLNKNNIPCMIYYPVSLHKQEAYMDICRHGDLPVSEQLCKEVISLPMSPNLDSEQVDYITNSIKDFININSNYQEP
ncbi:MAG: aminotransferase class I/II-fold pyridoxal phosphate-dependent enzyme [Bacteroidetes bacterium]|nr:aminotransferase class I/II-fold pyridoxal phosphate-dependent enzyme [Bacteroidota bacterium]